MIIDDIFAFTDINIIFFNIINFFLGLFIIIYNLKGLDDCDNIILLSSISTINSLLTISWFVDLCNNRLCTFIISSILLVYNLINYHSLTNSCINYFGKEAIVIWYYYIVNIYLQIFNVLSYTLLFCLALRILNKEKIRTNRNTNMNTDIYDDDEILIEDLEKII